MSYKDTVLPIIRETRAITLPYFGNVELAGIKSEHPADVVTEIDKNVENFLKEKLALIYPNIEFVGEKFSGNRNAKSFWLVDPVDGTGHYMRGIPFCTTMLALIEDGEVIFSVIYDFINDDIYFAEKGKGAYKNDTPIHVSDRNLAQSYICMETHSTKKENQLIFAEITKKAGDFHSISAGWEFAMVASGKLDARIAFDPWGKDYDFAPGCLLVSEAGGIVTNINSNKYDYRNVNLIAATPKVYNELKEIFINYKIPA